SPLHRACCTNRNCCCSTSQRRAAVPKRGGGFWGGVGGCVCAGGGGVVVPPTLEERGRGGLSPSIPTRKKRDAVPPAAPSARDRRRATGRADDMAGRGTGSRRARGSRQTRARHRAGGAVRGVAPRVGDQREAACSNRCATRRRQSVSLVNPAGGT